MSPVAFAVCDEPVATIISIQGTVEYSASGPTQWHAASVGQGLCAGDLLTVRRFGRAAVQFEGEVLTRLDQFTTLEIAATPRNGDVALGLREGVAHVISRLRKRVEVISPVVNALVEGTEFTVLAKSDGNAVVVAEGRVRVSNAQGDLLVAGGQAARLQASGTLEAIQVRPLDAARWAMYYPVVVRPASGREDVAALADQGRFNAAMSALGDASDAQDRVFQANLLLGVGRWKEAGELLDDLPASADREAVRAVMRVRQGAVAEARATVKEAASSSPALQLASSYVLQAEGDLQAAHAAVERALTTSSDNALAWARRAELELMLGRTGDARSSAQQALALSPRAARAKAMVGFSYVLEARFDEAANVLTEAIREDASDPLAHYALGLNDIRRGELVTGRQELETAVLLDPFNVEYRATLGRAYMAERQDKRAATQLDLAGELDPASPTPRFFEAQRRLGAGDVVGAIAAGREALALNDNRLTLRGPEMLATDRAARATTLGSAYQVAGLDAGLKQMASEAVQADPASAPAHRLMAQAYSDDLRLETARVSEQFQGFAYGELGDAAIAPQDLVTALPMLDGPRLMSSTETARLFQARPARFSAEALVGTQDTAGLSVTGTVASDRAQIGIGHLDYNSDGFASGGDINLGVTRAEARVQAGSGVTLFGDLQHVQTDVSDNSLGFFNNFDSERLRERSDLVRLGGRFSLGGERSLIVYGAREDGDERYDWTNSSSVGPFSSDISSVTHEDVTAHEIGLRLDGLHGRHSYLFAAAAGRSKRVGSSDTETQTVFNFPPFPPFVFPPVSDRVDLRTDASQRRVMGQWSFAATDSILITPRLDYLDFDGTRRVGATDIETRPTERLMPSIGLVVTPRFGTSVHAAFLQGVSYNSPGNQSLFPTRFADSDATFDDISGTRYRRVAVGAKHQFGQGALFTGEWSYRKFDVPSEFCATSDCSTGGAERRHQLMLSMPVSRTVIIEGGWRYESMGVRDLSLSGTTVTFRPQRLRTESLPLRMYWQAAPWLGTLFETIRIRHEADVASVSGSEQYDASFWVANIRLQLHAEGSRWRFGVNALNLFDQKDRVQDTDLMTGEARTPLWYPERALFMNAAVSF